MWLGAALVLALGALCPAAWLGLRGGPVERLVGPQLAGALLVPVLLLLTTATARPATWSCRWCSPCCPSPGF